MTRQENFSKQIRAEMIIHSLTRPWQRITPSPVLAVEKKKGKKKEEEEKKKNN